MPPCRPLDWYQSLTRTITSLQAATQPPAEATGSSTPQAQVQPSPETTCTAAEGAALARLGLYAGSLADVDDRMKCADVATCLEVCHGVNARIT
ncbi:unnamed protein product [Closterium sp. NIES-53]